MKIVTKYKKEIIAAIGIVILFFISRIILIGNFPIFTDEAIYVRWTQIAANDASWRFISLTDGKQPMLVWIGMIFLKLFNDPLVAVRMVSGFAGFATLIGLFLLSYELFRNRLVSFLTALIYVVYPFAVVYDRLALYDSIVAAFAIWAIYFSVLLVRRIRLDVALILGFILGGGMLTKTNANFSIMLLPITLLLFNFKDKKWKVNIIKWGLLALLAVLIAEVMYNSLRLSPFFHIIKEKNTIFVYYPLSIPISQNIELFIGNLKGLVGWLFTYLTPSLLILIIASFFSKNYLKEKLILLGYFSLPFLALALFGKAIFPRFIFFMSVYLLPLAAYGLYLITGYINKFMKERKMNMPYLITGAVVLLFLIYPAKVSIDFIFNPAKANIADADKRQYITEWPAGYGVKESINFFENEAKNKKIFVATEGTFGLMPYALDIYLGNNPNITTKGYWPINEFPEELEEIAKDQDVYFIFYQPCPSCEFSGDAPDDWPLDLVDQYKKNDNTFFSIYKYKN